MKAKALSVFWHLEQQAIYNAKHNQPELQPIYSADFQPGKGGRLATAGGDNKVRLWRLEYRGDEVSGVQYLSTLSRHTQAVNVVRFDHRGHTLASAGDDGTIALWELSDTVLGTTKRHSDFADPDAAEDVESWLVRRQMRIGGSDTDKSDVYDLAWSPDDRFIIAGSMDNVARIFDAKTGNCIRQLAEHSFYVQGVAWDPLNEYLATQSSDRSVHIYTLKAKNDQFALHSERPFTMSRAEVPSRRFSSSSSNSGSPLIPPHNDNKPWSPPVFTTTPTPGTPASHQSSMNPPPPVSVKTHSRKSSFSSTGSAASSSAAGAAHGAGGQSHGAASTAATTSSLTKSDSPSPASMPLPAVRQIDSPGTPLLNLNKGQMSYISESFTSFFRRLTFSPDGSLLFTPSGLFKHQDGRSDEITNTVYIYSRAGLNRPPVAHLPGLKKPSLAVKCSPLLYKLRDDQERAKLRTKHMAIDTSASTEGNAPVPLPESIASSSGDPLPPPPPVKKTPVFKLSYRMVYAVATQDSVIVYDTQHNAPLCIVSNLHYATFTDLAWSRDGNTLLMTSADGFCSVITFAEGELGDVYTGNSPVSTPTATTKTTTADVEEATEPEPKSLTPVVSHVPPVMVGGGSPSSPRVQRALTPSAEIAASPLVERSPSIERATVAVPVKRESTVVDANGQKRRRIAPQLVSSNVNESNNK
ncbi:hypothetical protein TRVA0_008S02674 [Trichomonascus vanleenenianus]|uniref:Cac2p n=1 Tax=Trichomonascus vanleenenianus TaxID=2268995 RepID=UPI003ECAF73A